MNRKVKVFHLTEAHRLHVASQFYRIKAFIRTINSAIRLSH